MGVSPSIGYTNKDCYRLVNVLNPFGLALMTEQKGTPSNFPLQIDVCNQLNGTWRTRYNWYVFLGNEPHWTHAIMWLQLCLSPLNSCHL